MPINQIGAGGKQKAFTEAYKPLHDRLIRFVQSMVFNKEEVKDIVGETVLKTYENYETLRQKEALLSFMFTIASRLVYKAQENKKQHSFLSDSEHTDQVADTAASPHLKMEMKELYQAIHQLPEKQREALVMFEISGLSLNEIQQIQGDTLSAVKSRIARARESLKRILEEEIV